MNDAIKRVGQFLIQKEQTEASLDSHRKRESQIHKEILELMEKAAKSEGDEKYELIAKAHQLRSDTSGGNGQDGIYYEAQTELLENKLDVIKRRLAYEQLRQGLLTETIGQIKETIKELKDSPFHDDIRQGLEKSKAISGELLSKLKSHLGKLGAAVDQYYSIRTEASKGYKQSQRAYLQARGDSKTTKYAREMADRVQDELAHVDYDPDAPQNFVENPPGLWQEDVEFYGGVTDVLLMLVEVEGLRDRVVGVRQDIQNKASEAEKSISDLLGESG